MLHILLLNASTMNLLGRVDGEAPTYLPLPVVTSNVRGLEMDFRLRPQSLSHMNL
jgi:hypothetical protein